MEWVSTDLSGDLGTLVVTGEQHFRLLEHTADMGIEARATSREGVFEEMARGLKMLIFGDVEAEAKVSAELKASGDNPLDVLVAWLNEVVYWSEKDNLVPATFRVEALSDDGVVAVVAGEAFDALRHGVERQVKSVTYHQACLERTADGWYARVYVDL